MVAALTTDDFLVMTPLGNSSSVIGSQARNSINEIRAAFLATYGPKFVDIETVVINSYNPDLPQDVIDFNNGITPTSLRFDAIHLTYDGYDIVANYLLTNYPSFFQRSYGTTHIKYPGRSKYNLTRVSGTSSTLADADTYSFAGAHQVRVALGWEYGTDHWAFTDAGVPKVIAGSVIKSHGLGPDLYIGVNGIYIYA